MGILMSPLKQPLQSTKQQRIDVGAHIAHMLSCSMHRVPFEEPTKDLRQGSSERLLLPLRLCRVATLQHVSTCSMTYMTVELCPCNHACRMHKYFLALFF